MSFTFVVIRQYVFQSTQSVNVISQKVMCYMLIQHVIEIVLNVFR